MLRNLLFVTFILISTNALSIESNYNDFEAELRALENNQLRAEELQMNQADAVTDVITDEVATGQAGIIRNADLSEISDRQNSDLRLKKEVIKERRIRSR